MSAAIKSPRLIALVLGLATLLAGCGSDQPAPVPVGGVQPSVVTGAVFAQAPIAGATVRAFQVNPDGSQGPSLGTATTDEQGQFLLTLGSPAPEFLQLDTTGGTYRSTFNLRTYTMDSSLSMTMSRETLTRVQQSVVAIDELSTMATRRIRGLLNRGEEIRAAYLQANQAAARLAGLLEVDPVNLATLLPLPGGQGSNRLELDAALEALAVQLTAAGEERNRITGPLTEDFADGVLDGRNEGRDLGLPPDVALRLIDNVNLVVASLEGAAADFPELGGQLDLADGRRAASELLLSLISPVNPFRPSGVEILLEDGSPAPENLSVARAGHRRLRARSEFTSGQASRAVEVTLAASWLSSDPAVATVASSPATSASPLPGLVTGVEVGSADIEAILPDSASSGTFSDVLRFSVTGPAPGTPQGFLFASDSANSQIVTFPFDITTGTLGTPVQTPTATAGPGDLLVTRDEQHLLVATGSAIDVYNIDQATGALTLFKSTNVGFELRHLRESELTGVGLRFYAIKAAPPTQIMVYQLDASGNAVQITSFPFNGAFPFDLTSLQSGSTDYVFVSDNSTGVFVYDLPSGIPNPPAQQQFLFPGTTQLSELEVALPGGPVLEVLDLTQGLLISAGIDTSGGLATLLNPAASTQVATQARPRALATDNLSDVCYFGSELATAIDGFGLTGPPTAPTHLPNAPYAAAGNPVSTRITGVSNQLVYVLTSPQAALESFVQQADLSLSAIPNAVVTLPGASPNAQDLDAVILGD